MVRLEKSADPSVYPTTARATAVAALWSAWPALLLFPTGRIAAINQLTRWVTGLSPASLFDMNILELSAHLLGSQRVPATCNASFIVKKIESIERLPSGRQQFLPFFIERYEEAVKASSSPTEAASCPIMRGGKGFSDATPWHYPLFIQGGPDEGEDRLLQFTVIEACLDPKNHYLIILDPAESHAKKVVAKIYHSWQQRFPDEEYVVARDRRVDITLTSEYNRRQLSNPKIVFDIENVENIQLHHIKEDNVEKTIHQEQEEVAALDSGALVGVPVFEFRPRQSLSEHDLHRIACAIGAELVALPKHPELGPGTGFRLGSDAAPGRVTQVDVYLGRSQTKSAAVRVHRVDDFGEPHAPRYRFDVGYLQEGESPALVFRAPERNQERVITVFRDGRFDEVAGLSRANAMTLTVGEELSLAKLPPVFSVTDVAARLGITRAAVLAAIDRGRLAAHKIDGQWEISREDFAAYRQSTAHRRGAPAQI